jgi:hypothetical protein
MPLAVTAAVDKLLPVGRSEFVVTSVNADDVFEIGFFNRSMANLANAEDGYECIVL